MKAKQSKLAETTSFKVDDTFFSKSSGVKIAYLGTSFEVWMKGKVEEDGLPTPLTSYDLVKLAYDNEIITDLGGEEAAEVTLAEVWALMTRQADGKEGVLFTNGDANLFYVRDNTSVLRAVYVYWYNDSGGWGVYSYALGDYDWYRGRQVFSRNPACR